MMTSEEVRQDYIHRKTEAKLIAKISKTIQSGLISDAIRIYLENTWMEERIFSRNMNDDEIDSVVDELHDLWKISQ